MADYDRSKAVYETLDKVMQTAPPELEWMDPELAHSLLASFQASYHRLFMQLMRAGADKATAEEQARTNIPLLMFDLGMKVGIEHEAARAMRELFGED